MKKLNRLTLPLALLLISQSAGRAIAQSAEGFDGDIYSTDIGSPTETQIDGDGCEWEATWDDLPTPLFRTFGPGLQSGTMPFWMYFGTDISGWEGTGGSAFGQIFLSLQAQDNLNFPLSAGALTFSSEEWVRLKRIDHSSCGSEIEGTLKPKFRISTAVANDASLADEYVEVSGQVILTIPMLELVSNLTGAIRQSDSGSSFGGTFNGAMLTIPIPVPSSGSNQTKATYVAERKVKKKLLSDVTLYTQQLANASCLADGWSAWPIIDESKVEGFLHDSLAGARLVGTCLPRFGPGGGGGGGTPVFDGTESFGPCSCTEGRTVECSWY